MPHPASKHLLVLAACAALTWSAPVEAEGACPSGPLAIDNITDAAVSAWADRPGERATAIADASERAVTAVPGRVTALDLSLAPDLAFSGPDATEYIGAASVAIELGRLRSARQDALQAESEALLAELDAERWRFVESVQDAYLHWRSQELERAHLEHYAEHVAEELVPIREASASGVVTRLDLADMEAEVARVRVELADASRREAIAKAHVSTLLGVDCELSADADAVPSENPWTGVVAAIDRFPEVKAFERRAQANEAQARVLKAAAPWTLNLGLGARTVAFDEHFVTPIVGLTIPLGNPDAAGAVVAKAAAQTARSNGSWRAMKLKREMEAASSTFEALRTHQSELQTSYLGPLTARAELMAEAFRVSEIEIFRLIQARRDLHEAEHRLLLVGAEIQSQRLKASAIEQLLSLPTNR